METKTRIFTADANLDFCRMLERVAAAEKDAESIVPPTVNDWQYGFAPYDEAKQRTGEFQKLPHFTGAAWQGGAAWPEDRKARAGGVSLALASRNSWR